MSKKIRLTLISVSTVVLLTVLCILSINLFKSTSIVVQASREATNYTIDAIYNDDTKTLFATQTVDYKNTSSDTLNSVCFHLYPHAFSETAKYRPVSESKNPDAYPNGVSYGDISIKNVKVNNKETSFEIGGKDNDILVVPIATQLFPNSRASISMEFDVNIPNIRHRFGYTENAVNLGNFYPVACVYNNGAFDTSPYSYNGDPFYSDIANYSVTLTCDSAFVVASTGECKKNTTKSDKTKHCYTALAVRDFAMVLSKKFKVLNAKTDKISVSYYYYSDEKPQNSLETAVKTVKTFNKLFGAYPYTTLAVVETGFLHGGMEFPNLVYISDDLSSYEEYTNVIVHEIAHQWWYGVVGDNQNIDGWIDEGLAEYSCILFYENNPDYQTTREKIISDDLKSYLLFSEVYCELLENFDTSMTRPLVEYKTEPEYTYMAYVKSTLMFDNVRNMIGDKKFLHALKTFYHDNSLKFATRETLIFAFENSSGIPLKSVFDSWLDGKIVIAGN